MSDPVDTAWSADNASTWNDREKAVYETGHREGKSCRQADWNHALTEWCDLPDGIDPEDAKRVAEYIASLQSRSGSCACSQATPYFVEEVVTCSRCQLPRDPTA